MRRLPPALAAFGLAAIALASLFTRAQAPLFPRGGGPIRDLGLDDARLDPRACGECHAEIEREWRSSAHAASWRDAIFQAEYREGPQAFCRDCHDPRGAGDGGAGIDCAVCHVRSGRVAGAHGASADLHAARGDPRMSDERACAACHEFDFHAAPGTRLPTYDPSQPLQRTVTEWTRSRAASRGVACQGCHMRRVGVGSARHVDHRFPGLGDAAMRARAVRVRVRARASGDRIRVEASLRPGRIGHAFPTGDMFRQGRWTVESGGAVATERLQRWFAQSLAEDGRGFWLREVDDTRVPPDGARRIVLTLPRGRDDRVRWRLDVWRLDPDVARARGIDEADARVPVTSGEVSLAR